MESAGEYSILLMKKYPGTFGQNRNEDIGHEICPDESGR